jgi:hypothetical protein
MKMKHIETSTWRQHKQMRFRKEMQNKSQKKKWEREGKGGRGGGMTYKATYSLNAVVTLSNTDTRTGVSRPFDMVVEGAEWRLLLADLLSPLTHAINRPNNEKEKQTQKLAQTTVRQ